MNNVNNPNYLPIFKKQLDFYHKTIRKKNINLLLSTFIFTPRTVFNENQLRRSLFYKLKVILN